MLKKKEETDSLAHTRWNCKYHIVFAPKYRRQIIYGQIKGYYVDTVGRNKKAIAEYIRNQLAEDKITDQMTIKEYYDPFTGEPVNKSK